MKITVEIDTDRCIAEVTGDSGVKELLHIPDDLHELVVKQLPRAIAIVYRDSKGKEQK